MMKLKKFVSYILALCMSLCALIAPVSASASSDSNNHPAVCVKEENERKNIALDPTINEQIKKLATAITTVVTGFIIIGITGFIVLAPYVLAMCR